MGSTVTTVPVVTDEQFAARQGAVYPTGWASPTAKLPGGVMFALLETFGDGMAFCFGGGSELAAAGQGALAYALSSMRIQTAVAPELDEASEDFLGNALPRQPGETNESYRARILAALPPTGATRDAIVAGLTALTGVVPRIMEPWLPSDTGAWDAGISYIDVDTQANPAVLADPTMHYQACIISAPPPPTQTGTQPLQTLDDSLYIDVPGYGLLLIMAVPPDAVFELIDRMHVEGTIVWVRIGSTHTP